jgi:hypothetical protein
MPRKNAIDHKEKIVIIKILVFFIIERQPFKITREARTSVIKPIEWCRMITDEVELIVANEIPKIRE